MAKKSNGLNEDRLLRAVRALQQIQRDNAPNTSLAKATDKALKPLLIEHSRMVSERLAKMAAAAQAGRTDATP